MDIPLPVQGATGREKVVPTLVAMAAELRELRSMLEEALARPQVVIREWRPDHRRIADGGEQVRTQRKRVVLDGAEVRAELARREYRAAS